MKLAEHFSWTGHLNRDHRTACQAGDKGLPRLGNAAADPNLIRSAQSR